MSSIFQKVAETPLRLRAEPVLLRLFGTAMAFVFAEELRNNSALEENSTKDRLDSSKRSGWGQRLESGECTKGRV